MIYDKVGDQLTVAGVAIGVATLTGLLLASRWIADLAAPLMGAVSDKVGRRRGALVFFLLGAADLASPNDSLAVTPSYDYLLRHTACPTLEVRLPGPATPRQEMRLLQRGWQRAEARAVLLSVASLFEKETRLVPTLNVAAIIADLPGAPDPRAVDWAELDGNLLWSPVPTREDMADPADLFGNRPDPLDSSGEPGLPDLLDRHTLEIQAGGERQLWLLERSGSGFSARLMMQNP